MRRVSSRQRLVSWDAFEASDTHHDGSDYSSTDSESSSKDQHLAELEHHINEDIGIINSDQDCFATISAADLILSLSRSARRTQKRSRRAMKAKQQQQQQHLIPPTFSPVFSWELAQEPQLAPPEALLDSLNEDVQMHIVSFLDLKSFRTLMSTHKRLRTLLLLQPEQTSFVWETLCSSKSWWSAFARDNKNASRPWLLRDNVQLPIAANEHDVADQDKNLLNVPILCSWIPEHLPTSFHTIFARGCPRWKNLFSLKTFHDDAGCEWIQYTGQVGIGDRCVRADHPLPRPEHRHRHKHHSFLELLCRGNRAAIEPPLSGWRPFCAPHVTEDGTLDLTPRMVSYFEVSIRAKEEDAGNAESLHLPPQRNECVAVGLATESFPLYSRMPGWDRMSYGYHGDDGGKFHSSGGMVEKFGPSFGAGDTVGCGVDHVSQSIFYTLNGEFLGYAWRGLDWDVLQNDLYPVVGIDTNVPICMNFGQSPFAFNISNYIASHHTLIQEAYHWNKSHADHDHHHHHHYRHHTKKDTATPEPHRHRYRTPLSAFVGHHRYFGEINRGIPRTIR